jgi:hypothetical protein
MKKRLNSNRIKLIAIAAMTVDHLTWTLFPGTQSVWYVFALHVIGRLTAPIMWFFIAEGYMHTHNFRKYALRLLLFAIVSHFAYCFAFGISFLPFVKSVFNQTSVIWSLFWGLITIRLFDSGLKTWLKFLLLVPILAVSFPSDWSCIAVVAILYLWGKREVFAERMAWMMVWTAVYALVFCARIDPVYGMLQLCTMLSIPLLRLYNGRRGTWKGMKWFFYIYYPAHLVAVGILRVVLDAQHVMIGG